VFLALKRWLPESLFNYFVKRQSGIDADKLKAAEKPTLRSTAK
jgi:hypothetical protein